MIELKYTFGDRGNCKAKAELYEINFWTSSCNFRNDYQSKL